MKKEFKIKKSFLEACVKNGQNSYNPNTGVINSTGIVEDYHELRHKQQEERHALLLDFESICFYAGAVFALMFSNPAWVIPGVLLNMCFETDAQVYSVRTLWSKRKKLKINWIAVVTGFMTPLIEALSITLFIVYSLW